MTDADSTPSDAKPVRLQLRRYKGYRLQDHSLACNGLPAVNVARPSQWGNPFKVGRDGTAKECVAKFREFAGEEAISRISEPLRGKNLACWCSPADPCHADVLLDLANLEPTP